MKIYLVGYYSDNDDYGNVQCIIKATASRTNAIKFINDGIYEMKNSGKYIVINSVEDETEAHWTVEWKYNVKEGDVLYGKEYETTYRLEEIDVGDDTVPEDMTPELERRINGLTKEVEHLVESRAKVVGHMSMANSYLTMYDGGRYESFDDLLKRINKARAELSCIEKKYCFHN